MKLQKLPDNFTYTQAEMVRLQNDFGKKGTATMLRNWVSRHYIEKIPPKDATADGADGNQGGKVFSIQLFSFKKLLIILTTRKAVSSLGRTSLRAWW